MAKMLKLRKMLIVLLMLATLLTGCKGIFGRPIEEEAPTPTPIPTPIVPEKPTYVVQRGKVTKQVEFTGRISAVEETELYFKTGGYVKRVLVQRGDQVQAGDLLAELEIDDLLRQMAQAEVTLNSAQLRLSEAEEALERQIARAERDLTAAQAQLTEAEEANADAIAEAESALQTAQINLDEAEKANAQQLAEAQRTLEAAQIGLAQLQEEPDSIDIELLRLSLDRAKNDLWDAQLERDAVRSKSGIPQYEKTQMDITVGNAEIAVREAELRYEQALEPAANEDDIRLQQIEVEGAEAALAELQAGVSSLLSIEVQRAQRQLDKLNEGVDPLLTIEVQRVQQELDWLREGVDPVLVNEVNQAQLALERLQAQVADAQIVAAMGGRILSLSVYAGRPAEAFKPVVVIADPSAIEVSADLSSTQLQDMMEGQEAIIVLSAYPGQTWYGTVRRLPYPYGSGGGTGGLEDVDMSTRISMEGDLSDLELGDLARVTIVLEEKDDVLWLPPEAIRTFQGREFVILQDVDRQRRVDVEIGIEGEDRVEILEGLEEGQLVVGQ
jgi:multidrug efflux pump subunit AcrA (membrane-fusion protein)